jgi:pimeloyl-ACP methyl ester carboxylesterase
MTERTFAQSWAGEGRRLPYWEAGSGETIVTIADDERLPTRAHALLAERRRVIVFAMMADAGTSREAARRIGAAVAGLGVERFDLMGEGAGAAAAVWLALARQDIGSVALAAPDGLPDEAFREIKRPVLVLSGTKDGSDAGDRYRTLLPDCHFMFLYDAGRAIGAERPEALAYIALEFFERRDLLLVTRESGMAFPSGQERKFRDRPRSAGSGHSGSGALKAPRSALDQLRLFAP